MSTGNILHLAHQLTQERVPFVLATVVWCERPTSARPGAQAIIQGDGTITGWIGGSCAQPVVIREAMRILSEGGDPYLLRLGSTVNEPGVERRDVRIFPMSCTSGGTLDIYIEPHFPQPQLLLIGRSPVIVALQQLAPVLDFTVTYLDSTDISQVEINEWTYILVATHGQYDEIALEQVLPGGAAYIGLVSSRRRAEACRAYLRTSGIAEQHIARLKAPAGLDIGAVTPEEIAASILAELVFLRRHAQVAGENVRDTAQAQPASSPPQENPPELAATSIDPVCGMLVEIAGARHRVHHEGRDFFFCCPSCKRSFERDPQEYLVQHPTQ